VGGHLGVDVRMGADSQEDRGPKTRVSKCRRRKIQVKTGLRVGSLRMYGTRRPRGKMCESVSCGNAGVRGRTLLKGGGGTQSHSLQRKRGQGERWLWVARKRGDVS